MSSTCIKDICPMKETEGYVLASMSEKESQKSFHIHTDRFSEFRQNLVHKVLCEKQDKIKFQDIR